MQAHRLSIISPQTFEGTTLEETNQMLIEMKPTSVELKQLVFSFDYYYKLSWSDQPDVVHCNVIVEEFRLGDPVEVNYLDKWKRTCGEKAYIQSLSIIELKNQQIAFYITMIGQKTGNEYSAQYLITPHHYEMVKMGEKVKMGKKVNKLQDNWIPEEIKAALMGFLISLLIGGVIAVISVLICACI